jgi:hypothetical protein
MNKETFEESAKKLILAEWLGDDKTPNLVKWGIEMGFEKGVKWKEEQDKNKFSEEDMISFAHFYFQEEFNSTMQNSKSTDEILQEWFKQNKNK